MTSSSPWQLIPGTRYLTSRMADIDADGCEEVIALSPEFPGLAPQRLGVLSYFDNTALSETYPAPQPPQLLVTGSLPFNSSQSVVPVSVRGKGLVDLMVFDSQNGTLSLYSWIDSKLAYRWATSSYVYGVSQWPLTPGNRFFIGDIDGDGADEIIALSLSTSGSQPAPANLAVMKWINNSDIRVIWTAPGGVIPGKDGYSPWNVYSADRFYVGDIDHDQVNEIVAFDGNSIIGLMKWADTELQQYWITSGSVYSVTTGVPNWPIASGDWFHLADIDGDGRLEMVAANGNQLGAFAYNGSDLRVIGVNTGSVPATSAGGSAWQLQSGDVHYVADIQTTTAASIAVFNSGAGGRAPQIGVLKWNAALPGFTADQVTSEKLIGNNQTWTLGTDNGFAMADVDGDGLVELVAQSDSASAVGYLKWIADALAPVWICSTAGGGNPPPQGWGAGVIANAPATSFSWPTETQQAIYEQTSSSLTQYSYQTNDIRSGYANSSIQNNLTSYASDLSTALSDLNQPTPIYYWPWMSNYDTNDLRAVLTTLETEFLAVSDIWQFDQNMDSLLNSVYTQQLADLQTVQDNLVPPGSATTSFWTGQILDAAIWAIAALPLGAPVQFALAAAASLFGSLIASVNGGAPDQSAVDQLQAQLETNCKAATLAVDYMVYNPSVIPATGIITDPVKIPLIGKYIAGMTAWDSGMVDAVSAQSSNFNQIGFYQQLTNQVFEIHLFANLVDPNLTRIGYSLIPDYASWTQIGTRSCTVRVMARPDLNVFIPSTFPTQDLLNDLQSLGFSQESMINGEPGLSLTVKNMSYDAMNEGCVIYTTNYTGSDVWVTIYDQYDENLAHGNVAPGVTQLWQNCCIWSNPYNLQGEVKDAAGNSHKFSIGAYPQQTFEGKLKGYAFEIQERNGEFSWGHLDLASADGGAAQATAG